jgi:uncharacterized protein YndB with AHSA1/START domain
MTANGAPERILEGEVVELDPPRRLVQTWHALFDEAVAAFDEAVAAEAVTRLTWELEEEYGLTRLTLVHDLAGAPDTAAWVRGDVPEVGGGWPMVHSDLKTLLETGTSFAG